ncbi:DNA gyrase inhibitor YacG [Mariprofundus micogutta]|uniref:DNA gyrase inhibitor YacG n=1 Tax=Mariprofundus micogutta TaxID=1921010 RepID=UPI001D1245EC|nr:DNA gyrase inhibitor YacG [Mariprofundus micogutta]
MSATEMKFRCPTCRKAVERTSDYFPFCSDRCKTTDLGRWAAGEYSIPGENAYIPDDSEGHF